MRKVPLRDTDKNVSAARWRRHTKQARRQHRCSNAIKRSGDCTPPHAAAQRTCRWVHADGRHEVGVALEEAEDLILVQGVVADLAGGLASAAVGGVEHSLLVVLHRDARRGERGEASGVGHTIGRFALAQARTLRLAGRHVRRRLTVYVMRRHPNSWLWNSPAFAPVSPLYTLMTPLPCEEAR